MTKLEAVYLGNLSVPDIENQLEITLNESDKEKLTQMRHQNANDIPKDKFHCFDIPFVIMAGSKDTAIIIRDILSPYQNEMKGQIEIKFENR